MVDRKLDRKLGAGTDGSLPAPPAITDQPPGPPMQARGRHGHYHPVEPADEPKARSMPMHKPTAVGKSTTPSDGSRPTRHRVALRDVALAANVHPSTASRALNATTKSRVNPATAARVIEAARRVGYEPNSLARSLRTNRSYVIGMTIPDLTNPIFPPIVKGIEDRLSQDGYTLMLANTNYDVAREETVVRALVSRQVDGLLLATVQRTDPLVQRLLDDGLKVVLVNRTLDDAPVASVTDDEYVGIGLAVRHLSGLGHKHIAYVGGDPEASTGLMRYQAFLSWMDEVGLLVDPALVAHAARPHEEPGAAAFAALLDRGVPVTAVIAANDRLALGCYDALNERGLRVPDDVSVVGYNDILWVDKFAPPMTTIRVLHYQIGVKAAQLLLEAIGDSDSPPMSVRLTPTLVVRESTGPPRS